VLTDHLEIRDNAAVQKSAVKNAAQAWFFLSLIAFGILFLLFGKASLSSFFQNRPFGGPVKSGNLLLDIPITIEYYKPYAGTSNGRSMKSD